MKRKTKVLFYILSKNDSCYILLGHRKVNDSVGFWWFPGGSAEENESDFGALVRELAEEIELPPSVGQMFENMAKLHVLPPSLKYLTAASVYTVFLIRLQENYVDILPCIKDEFDELKWADLENLPHNMSREFEYIRKNITTAYLRQTAESFDFSKFY